MGFSRKRHDIAARARVTDSSKIIETHSGKDARIPKKLKIPLRWITG
jgi:hypothetical protein